MKLQDKLKVVTVVGTRPELIKMSAIIKKFDVLFDHVFIHTGQNYDEGLRDVFYDDLEIRLPDYSLNLVGTDSISTISKVLIGVSDLLKTVKPDAFVIYGDTNSCLSVIAAKKLKIPIFHLEAGNRCFNENVPEEVNRKIVDHLSDINMPLTEHARQYLLDEGLKGERIFKIGSTLPEVIQSIEPKLTTNKILEKHGLSTGAYFLVSIHREENVDDETNRLKIVECLHWLKTEYNLPILVSLHPRTKSKLAPETLSSSDFNFAPPFNFSDYLTLQKEAKIVISDSGTITEESSILGFRAITIRNENERPEGFDSGVLLMSTLSMFDFKNAVQTSLGLDLPKNPVHDYADIRVADKVCKIVSSYSGFVKQKVWSKI